MVISFICNPIYVYGEGGWSPESRRLGGSEEFIVEVAKRMAEQHEVTVYHNGKHGVYDDVAYKAHEDFEECDVVVNVNYPQFRCETPQILWTSLTEHPDLSHFKAVCYISAYALDNTGIDHENVFWVPPGYDDGQVYPDKKIPKQCFYASSPDRGLDTLLGAWPRVYEAHPDATLILTYGGQAHLPGVINLGEVDEQTMNDVYRTSVIWCHPANGGELYCMTGIKAQAAGCYPLIIPVMALAETVLYGRTTDKEHYADALIDLLNKKEFPKYDYKYPTWADSTENLLNVVDLVYKEK